MLSRLITSQTRVKLLIKFFINESNVGYLRSLEREFKESTNAIQKELINLEKLGLLRSFSMGNKRLYKANSSNIFFHDVRNMLFKEIGFEKIKKNIEEHIPNINGIFVFGDYARGIQSNIIDLALVGDDLNDKEIDDLLKQIEVHINHRIRFLRLTTREAPAFFLSNRSFKI